MKIKLNQIKLKLAIVLASALGSASLSTVGYAATAFDNMIVSTAVVMSCTIDAGALTFATYDPTSASDNDAEVVITSTCSNGGSATITMGVGGVSATGSTDAIPLRQLYNSASGAPRLPYFLYQNAARDTVWGNTLDTGVAFTAVEGTNSSTLYGRIPAGQTASVGSYNDNVSVTLTY